MTDKKDWANISDDEDESSEESPEPVSSNQPIEHVEPQEQQEQQQVETQHEEKQEHQRRHHDRPRRSEDEKKTEILRELEGLAGPKVYLNLHGLNPNVKADVIREFYQPITISSVIASQTKEGLFDLEFANKEDAVKAIEKGTGELGKSKFCLRMSNRNYPKDSTRPYEKKDRGNKNYGQKGQGNRGGYDNRNRDDYYYNKNQEGGQRGGYDKKNRDQGSWKQGGDRDQGSWKQGGGPRNETQYQVRTKDNEERKNEEQQFSNVRVDKRQDSDKWEKGLQLPDEPRKQEFKKRDDYQRRDDNQGNYRDKFQMKKYNSDYTEGGHGYSNRGSDYRNNEEKSDTIEKGRGAKKYNQDEPLEQDKILQMKDKQSSYKSQGSDKGYHKKEYNKGYDKGYGGGYGGDNYNKSRYYDDQKNYKGRPKDNEYYQGKGEEGLQIEKKSSKTNRDESYKVYTKKSDNAGQDANKGNQTPSGSTSTPELVKKASSTSQGSKNTANPFSILENENGKK